MTRGHRLLAGALLVLLGTGGAFAGLRWPRGHFAAQEEEAEALLGAARATSAQDGRRRLARRAGELLAASPSEAPLHWLLRGEAAFWEGPGASPRESSDLPARLSLALPGSSRGWLLAATVQLPSRCAEELVPLARGALARAELASEREQAELLLYVFLVESGAFGEAQALLAARLRRGEVVATEAWERWGSWAQAVRRLDDGMEPRPSSGSQLEAWLLAGHRGAEMAALEAARREASSPLENGLPEDRPGARAGSGLPLCSARARNYRHLQNTGKESPLRGTAPQPGDLKNHRAARALAEAAREAAASGGASGAEPPGGAGASAEALGAPARPPRDCSLWGDAVRAAAGPCRARARAIAWWKRCEAQAQ